MLHRFPAHLLMIIDSRLGCPFRFTFRSARHGQDSRFSSLRDQSITHASIKRNRHRVLFHGWRGHEPGAFVAFLRRFWQHRSLIFFVEVFFFFRLFPTACWTWPNVGELNGWMDIVGDFVVFLYLRKIYIIRSPVGSSPSCEFAVLGPCTQCACSCPVMTRSKIYALFIFFPIPEGPLGWKCRGWQTSRLGSCMSTYGLEIFHAYQYIHMRVISHTANWSFWVQN